MSHSVFGARVLQTIIRRSARTGAWAEVFRLACQSLSVRRCCCQRRRCLTRSFGWQLTSPSADFPVAVDLALDGLVWLVCAVVVSSSWQQRWRRLALEVPLHRFTQVVEHAASLLGTRRHYRPDPLAPALPRRAARPLRYQAVDHHEADRLLRQVVRRLHSRRGHEREVTAT